ncbi:hypothetical protein DFS34DRAFT_338620 [Phlyctochytrium arcticum]|nr:hypothetical protein DFS34DRAFT_338620 [Phlyctochytrium arcticum]
MLKPRLIAQVLQQANTSGITASLLLNADGSLVSFAGGSDKDAKVLAAVVSNVWFAYERHGKPRGAENTDGIEGKEGLRDLFLECEHGRLSITKASRMLLCLVAEESVEWGLIKAKTSKIREHIEQPLNLVNI